MNPIELNQVSELIENEIHATHSISDPLYEKIREVVENIPDINEPLNIRDSRLKLLLSLDPLSFKMFQYLIAAMEKVIPEPRDNVIKHIANVVLVKAFKYFPDHTEIYIAYALRKMLNDRDSFIHDCMKDKINNIDNHSTTAGNMFYYIMLIVFVGFIISVIISIKKTKQDIKYGNKLERQQKRQGIYYTNNEKSSNYKEKIKKQYKAIKSYLKELKKNIKSN